MNKILILYYSYDGSTEKIAKYLHENLTSDIERVSPIKEMKAKGFCKYIVGGGQVIMKKKPKLKPLNVDINDYDTILIGSPIWAGTFTPPIYSLLDSNILENKKIGYFYCSRGGDKNAKNKAKTIIENNNTFISSCSLLSVDTNYEKEKLKALSWARGLL